LKQQQKVLINEQIRAKELRVIDDAKGNVGVISTSEALKLARSQGLDLIEISPNTEPPIAKIMDYGKYQYDVAKKLKEVKAKSHIAETKGLQVKVGTGDHDLEIKAKQASKWLKEGHRVKIELFLRGRTKYMEERFLKERLDRVLHLISENFKIAEEAKRSPKGLAMVIEKAK
jgi:translation initiation factor IF-3